MEERRKSKRLDLDVVLKLERLEQNGVSTVRDVSVKVTDLSRTGIGFVTSEELELETYYDTTIQIWTKEIIPVVLQIVRRDKVGQEYRYGGCFIGMMEKDGMKIDIYQLFHEEDK